VVKPLLSARLRRAPVTLILTGLLSALPGCSLQRAAVDAAGSAIAGGGSSYAREEDPDLAAAAAPFGLKTVEGLLDISPWNEGLLLSAASGFTQYSYAFVQCEADYVEAKDLSRATELRGRAKKLYRRALGYALRGLEVRHPNFQARLRTDAPSAVADLRKSDVPLVYWTIASWGAAISLSKGDPELTADQGLVEALGRRALALDETFSFGALHDFFIAWEGGRPASAGGSAARAKGHLDRAMELSFGRRAAPLVSYAESVQVAAQSRPAFEETLKKAIAVDPDEEPDFRLANLIAQKRARWLLSRAGDLFID
jgi:predicted anti-sigma-YlaC factor YlaD